MIKIIFLAVVCFAAGCKHRAETHEVIISDTKHLAEDDTRMKADETVEVKVVDAPDRTTTIIDTYYPPEPLPPTEPGKPPPVRPPPALKSHTEKTVEHGEVTTDKTVKVAVAVDHHASSTDEGHSKDTKDTISVTDVGLSWQVKLAIAVSSLSMIFAFLKFTPQGRAIIAMFTGH